jgi:aspartate 1-decarboxylase
MKSVLIIFLYGANNMSLMRRTILKSKIHRATVTNSDRDYEGSILIDKTLLAKADILQWERVSVWNVTNGNRFETYALEGESGSGKIVIYGAAANLCNKNDLVIISSFSSMEDEEAKKHKPKVVMVDGKNKPIEIQK